jgi:acetyl esterase/lipase
VTHDGTELTGDVYMPKAPGTYPALVAVHGGAWQLGFPKPYRNWGPYLAARGYVVFAIQYRLAQPGKKMYPEAVHDVRAAVQFVRGNAAALKVDPQRIGLIGDSAGAHLASLVALAGDKPPFAGAYKTDRYSSVSTRVKVCVGVYGVYDFAAAWNYALVNRPLDNAIQIFLGVPLIENRQLYFEASPLSYAVRDQGLPPHRLGQERGPAFLLTWGTQDDTAGPHSSDSFLLALKQAGFFVRTVPIEGAPHFWISEPIEEAETYNAFLAPRLLRFLAQRL